MEIIYNLPLSASILGASDCSSIVTLGTPPDVDSKLKK